MSYRRPAPYGCQGNGHKHLFQSDRRIAMGILQRLFGNEQRSDRCFTCRRAVSEPSGGLFRRRFCLCPSGFALSLQVLRDAVLR